MKALDIVNKLNLKVFTGEELTDKKIGGCYIGDLLSLAMSKVQAGNVWITIQTNINIVAVASLTEAGCIIIADGFEPEESTFEKARMQEIVLLGSELSAYDIAKSLAEMGI